MTTLTISRFNADETKRSNLENEALKRMQNTETERHNRVMEQIALGELGVRQGSLSQQQYEFEQMSSFRDRTQTEVERNNRAMNAINALSASAAMLGAQASSANVAEQRRANLEREALSNLQLAETKRVNDMNANLRRIEIGQEGALRSRANEAQREYNRAQIQQRQYQTDASIITTLANIGVRYFTGGK